MAADAPEGLERVIDRVTDALDARGIPEEVDVFAAEAVTFVLDALTDDDLLALLVERGVLTKRAVVVATGVACTYGMSGRLCVLIRDHDGEWLCGACRD